MPYLLDGDNLVGKALGRRGSAPDRDALVREISDRLRRTRARAILWFDGAGTPVTLGSLSVRFAGPSSADDAIVRELERSRSAREMAVVTGDRELARRSRDAGARVVAPSEFWARFGTEREHSGDRSGQSPVDADDWMRWFADEKNRGR